jgi:hypothetical protein
LRIALSAASARLASGGFPIPLAVNRMPGHMPPETFRKHQARSGKTAEKILD